MKYAIVAVGYNRKKSLLRLLESLCSAFYDGNEVDLIISLDYSPIQNDIVDSCQNLDWSNGKKIIKAYSEKQGLRNHILKCGDLTSCYDAVVIFEDDLVVSKYFFKYVVQTVNRYDHSEQIAGISLYSHKINPGIGRPFESDNDGSDVFFMKYAQSWGQCWTKFMWDGFKQWYSSNPVINDLNNKVPQYVLNWNSQSWLKYYIAYCALNDKYYVYPYISLTTNCTEKGEHNSYSDSSYQVLTLNGKLERDYVLPLSDEGVKYDAFFERIYSQDILSSIVNSSKVCMDLYGLKGIYSDCEYVFSTKSLPYKTVKEYSLGFRPQEKNIEFQNEGYGIRLYDLRKAEKARRINQEILAKYDLKSLSSREALMYIISNLKKRLTRIKRK